MVYSIVHDLNLPDNFPVNEMIAFDTAAKSILTLPTEFAPDTAAWQEYVGATNLIGWRFRSCHENMTIWIESWNAHNADVSAEENYLRDRALFGMFTSGLSCIESTCYALHALASHSSILSLEFDNIKQGKASPKNLWRILPSSIKAVRLKDRLKVLIDSDDFIRLSDLRNRMSHRSNLPRNQTLSMGAELPLAMKLDFGETTSTEALLLDELFLENMITWLASSVCDLLVEGAVLAQ